MKILNKVFFSLFICILLFETFMISQGKLSIRESNWGVLVLLSLVLLLPIKFSRVLLFFISLYGIVTIFYYGNVASVSTTMEFTSGVNNAVFSSNTKSLFKAIIRGIPFYFYTFEIILVGIFFIKNIKISNDKESVT